jgi:hypothetical protein
MEARRPEALSLGHHETARNLVRLAVCRGEGKGAQAGAVLGSGHDWPELCAYRDRRRRARTRRRPDLPTHNCYDNNLVFAIDLGNKQIWGLRQGRGQSPKAKQFIGSPDPEMQKFLLRTLTKEFPVNP